MPEIFISYRRDDSLSATGRLADKLVQQFGTEQVFRDLDAIEAGADFQRAIVDTVRAASVILVIIGRTWADVRTADGRRRLDDPDDYVRREIETALAANIQVVPVLVEGAGMPKADALPDPLHPLALRQAFELSETRWGHDTGRLMSYLEQGLAIEPATPATVPTNGTTAATGLFRNAFLSAIGNYVPDLLALLVRPKKLIAKRNFGRNKDLAYALTFLALSLLLATFLGLGVWPERSSLFSLLLYSVIFYITCTLLLSLPLYMAWRLSGAPPYYRRIAVPLLYQAGISVMGFFLSVLVLCTALLLRDPKLMERISAILMEKSGALADRFGQVQADLQAAMQGQEFLIGATLMVLIWIYLACWLAASWGAYRQALGLSRWRSALACALFLLFAWLPLKGLMSFAVFLSAP